MPKLLIDEDTAAHVELALIIARSTIGFCLAPETFPVFLRWMNEYLTDRPENELLTVESLAQDCATAYKIITGLKRSAASLSGQPYNVQFSVNTPGQQL